MSEFLNQTSLLVLTCILEKLEPFVDRILVKPSNDTGSEWLTEQGPLDLAQVYAGRPQRGGSKPLRAVMWSPRTMPDRTAFWVNSEDGWATLFAGLSQAGGPETTSLRSSLPNEEWGVQEFIYRRAGAGQYEPARLLQWLEEANGYRLVQIGKRLPFEKGLKRGYNPIKTRADLLCFCHNFGIDLENNDFWMSDANAIYLNQVWRQDQPYDPYPPARPGVPVIDLGRIE